jgi:aminoglycoside phosphotransferase (APT) family kinase protein
MPERLVGVAEAAALVGGQFPELRGAPVEPLATGWDNTVHLVGREWVFRFPRREVALPGVRRELSHLPRLAARLPLPIPEPRLVGHPTADFPWPFWGARLIPGRELAEAGLSASVPAATAVGEFLRALHDPDLAEAFGAGLPDDPMGRATPQVRVPLTRPRLCRLAERGAWTPDPEVDRLLAEAEPIGPPAGALRIAHGDLHQRHVLVGDDDRVAGVIDWGDLCRADPAVDLSLAYGAFAGPARAALLAAYGGVDPEREARARVLAVSLCAALAEYAAAEHRDVLLRESLAGLGRAVAA